MKSDRFRNATSSCPDSPRVVFDVNHGQRNWAQTGFTSREMHSNFSGIMELLCRLGCVCTTTSGEPFAKSLPTAKLLIIPPATGVYDARNKRWQSCPDLRFTSDDIQATMNFLQTGGRLLAFGYRFGDSFTQSNLREFLSPIGCLLNDDAVIDLQSLRQSYPLDAYFDTARSSLPLRWSANHVTTVRWRTMATITILPGTNAVPLALSTGGNCISFNRTLRRISFSSLPIAVAGLHGRGRFAVFGGPHVFETGAFGLLASHDNACFLQNVLRWLLDEGDPDLRPDAISHHALGTFHFNNRMEVVGSDVSHADYHTISYVEKVLRRTGVLKALDRPQWLP